MSQHDFDIANQGFPATRADLNNALQALASASSGATAPSTTYANQLWYDTANNILKFRNEDNDAWIDLLYLDQTNDAVARLDVDNIRIDGNTISSTDTNGDITLDPDGTGDVIVSGSTLTANTTDNFPITWQGASGGATGALYGDGSSVGMFNGAAFTTGVWANNSNEVYVRNNGSNTVKIDSSGNVGIGTASPSYGIEFASSSGAGAQFGITYAPNSVTLLARAGGADANIGTVGSHPLLLKTGNTERMRIDSSGNMIMGRTAAFTSGGSDTGGTGALMIATDGARSLFLLRSGSNGEVVNFIRGGVTNPVGTISITTTATSYNTSSDHRLKENVEEMTGAIDRVKALAPKRFNFIADPDTTVDGFLAHEAQAIVPEAVTGTKDAMRDEQYEVTPAVLDDDGNVVTEAVMGTRSVPDYQGIDQSKLVPLLTGALQEAIAKIESLETRIAALEA